jgi:uncharacterized membrane protein YkvA (DUF1232 family)
MNQPTSFLTTPLSTRGIPVWAVYVMGVIAVIYMLNPGFGFIELLPDNLPIIGNLDEGGATMAIWYALVEYFEGKGKGGLN